MSSDNWTVLDKDATTEKKYGCAPEDRTIEQLLEGGWILLDKPSGPSSHQLAAWAREMLGVEKLGHGGTLDPFATGGLVLLSGSAMRLTGRVLKGDKMYICVIRLPSDVNDESLSEAISNLKGRIHNVPPKESAVKVQVRQRSINSFDIVDRDDRILLCTIDCEAGTYVRTLTRDLGLLLDGEVELLELRRGRSGPYSEDDAITMHQLSDAIHLWKQHDQPNAMKKILQPVESLLEGIPQITIKDGAASALSHGAPLASPGIVGMAQDVMRGDEVAIMSLKGEIVCLGTMSVNGSDVPNMNGGEVARPNLVLMPPETYPKRW
ncbi:MAG: RNA-guided pseudouridylation complex pseudouridine synthase subunit Cbf5 [Candidatus Thalassarchaeaceae archaeon]|nr:RNA-guided pseudouridylation complex pseudouridine synthase subunit Cbf5 [Candidatus Thalassarchaeaceae archaeon]MDP7042544.1 RNA-guided pseudouridylation complex pseudouridine synthase subunit Cbf5 [Candidatus Thalassarchaeaceae archaeon]